jgi:hypothetical protein
MVEQIGAKSLIPNPALAPLAGLIGEWRTSGTHPMFPELVVHGRASFSWHQGGAFVIMHSQIDDDPRFPSGVAVFGSDDGAGAFTMVYFDERDVSRIYEVTVGDGWVRWSRDDPHLAQTSTLTIDPSGRRMTGEGRMSRDGGEWEGDLSLSYERVADGPAPA